MNQNDAIQVNGTWIFSWRDNTGNLLKCREEHNLITQSGLEALAAIVIGELPQSSAIYLALGTGTTPATAGDTKLEAEGFRKIRTVRTRNLNEVRLRFFLTTGEANGDWSELGVFLAGTETVDSGRMLNRILPAGGLSKASNQVLTVEVRLNFAAG